MAAAGNFYNWWRNKTGAARGSAVALEQRQQAGATTCRWSRKHGVKGTSLVTHGDGWLGNKILSNRNAFPSMLMDIFQQQQLLGKMIVEQIISVKGVV